MVARVPVTELEYEKGREAFEAACGEDCVFVEAPADEAGLAAAVRECGARVVVCGTVSYVGPLYEALPEGGLIARYGVGADNLDFAICQSRGIRVCNTPGVGADTVAELAVCLMLCLARGLARFDREMEGGEWRPEIGTELRGKRLTVAGFGQIGRRVARAAGLGLGMKVTGFDQRPLGQLADDAGLSETEFRERWGLEDYTTDVAAALGDADVVSVHLAATPKTADFFNARTFGRMKPGALLVNTARGSLVDEHALYAALRSGRLGGAALDVFRGEPYEPVSPEADLRTLPNVVLTPHVGSNTAETNRRIAEACVRNVRRFLEGRPAEVTFVC